MLSTDFLPLRFAYGGVWAMLGEQEGNRGQCWTLNWSPLSLDGRLYLRSCRALHMATLTKCMQTWPLLSPFSGLVYLSPSLRILHCFPPVAGSWSHMFVKSAFVARHDGARL